ncbi:hypothetical protein Tco_0544244, partial [Tanacetum coccineum]
IEEDSEELEYPQELFSAVDLLSLYTMASTVICLATNQKFNFSKYIFDNMVKNLEGGVKFLMYPRFVQVFLDKQVERMSKHKEINVPPFHTKKVFTNMKRQGKDFSGRDIPLFPTIIKKQSRRKQRKDTEDPKLSGPTEPITDDTENVTSVPTHSNDPLLSEKTKTTKAAEITELKERVKKLEKKGGSRTHKLKRLYKVVLSAKVISLDDEACLGDQEDASKQGRKILDIDVDEDITLDSTHVDIDPNMFGVHDLYGDEVFIEIEEPLVNAATTTRTIVDEVKGQGSKDKGKEKMIESEKPLKKKDQITYDQEVALNLQAQLQAELDKDERISRQKEKEANIALIESWDNTQDIMDADYQMAQ